MNEDAGEVDIRKTFCHIIKCLSYSLGLLPILIFCC